MYHEKSVKCNYATNVFRGLIYIIDLVSAYCYTYLSVQLHLQPNKWLFCTVVQAVVLAFMLCTSFPFLFKLDHALNLIYFSPPTRLVHSLFIRKKFVLMQENLKKPDACLWPNDLEGWFFPCRSTSWKHPHLQGLRGKCTCKTLLTLRSSPQDNGKCSFRHAFLLSGGFTRLWASEATSQ